MINPLTGQASNKVDHQKWSNIIAIVIFCGCHPHPSFTFSFWRGSGWPKFGVMWFHACLYFMFIWYVYMHAIYFQLKVFMVKMCYFWFIPPQEVFLPFVNSNNWYQSKVLTRRILTMEKISEDGILQTW